MPALIRRFHEAKCLNRPFVSCWGSGNPLREFLHVDDLGEACIFALKHWAPDKDEIQYLNVGTGVDLSIKSLAQQIASVVGYKGVINWDTSKPDGTPKKQLDVSRFTKLGWSAKISLSEGLPLAYNDFLKDFSNNELRS